MPNYNTSIIPAIKPDMGGAPLAIAIPDKGATLLEKTTKLAF